MDFNCSEEVIKKVDSISRECINCKLCMSCEMLKAYCSSPKELFGDISAAKKVDPEIPYSCSMCRRCTSVCPEKLELGEAFMSMRREILSENNGASPMKGHKRIESHQNFSFSNIFNTTIKDSKAGHTKRVFIPGCSLSSYSPFVVGKTLEFLQERLPGTGAILMCCGKPTRDLGHTNRFKERYSKLQEEFEKLGVEEVITACQNCYVTISQESPKLRVRSLWEVIPKVGLSQEMVGVGKDSDIIFGIHDACPTRHNKEIYDGVRWIIKELGYKTLEVANSREKTNCCGFGGMIFPANPSLSKKVMINSALEINSDYVVTYCASCREAMVIAGKKSVHILNLMFNKGWNTNSDFPDLHKNFIKNWTNRYKTRFEIEKREK